MSDTVLVAVVAAVAGIVNAVISGWNARKMHAHDRWERKRAREQDANGSE